MTDDLRGCRGIALGTLLGLILWGLLIALALMIGGCAPATAPDPFDVRVATTVARAPAGGSFTCTFTWAATASAPDRPVYYRITLPRPPIFYAAGGAAVDSTIDGYFIGRTTVTWARVPGAYPLAWRVAAPGGFTAEVRADAIC